MVVEEKKERIMNDQNLSELEKREKIYSMLANKIYLPV